MLCGRNLFLVFIFFRMVFSLPNKVRILSSPTRLCAFARLGGAVQQKQRRRRRRRMQEGSHSNSPICLNAVNHQTGCGSSSLKGRQSSQFAASCASIPMDSGCAVYWNKPLYKEACHARIGGTDVPSALWRTLLSCTLIPRRSPLVCKLKRRNECPKQPSHVSTAKVICIYCCANQACCIPGQGRGQKYALDLRGKLHVPVSVPVCTQHNPFHLRGAILPSSQQTFGNYNNRMRD